MSLHPRGHYRKPVVDNVDVDAIEPGKAMFRKENNSGKPKALLTAALLAAMALTGAGCTNGYYPAAGYSYGGSPATMRSSSGPPPGYHYSDPDFCKGGAFCPLLLGAAIVGAAIALAN
jgi:hypothetical protein